MSYTDKQKNPVEAYHVHGISMVRQNTMENQKSSYLFVLVEMRGVEPLSEDPAKRLSPSAVCVFTFPLLRPRQTGSQGQ